MSHVRVRSWVLVWHNTDLDRDNLHYCEEVTHTETYIMSLREQNTTLDMNYIN